MATDSPGQLPFKTGDRTASSHESWLDEVVASIVNVQAMLELLADTTNSVTTGLVKWGSTPTDSGKTEAKAVPSDLTFNVLGYVAFINGDPAINLATTELTATGTGANPRIDRVVISVASGAPYIIEGVESGSPSAPALPSAAMNIALLHHYANSTIMYDTDQSSNSYIELDQTFYGAEWTIGDPGTHTAGVTITGGDFLWTSSGGSTFKFDQASPELEFNPSGATDLNIIAAGTAPALNLYVGGSLATDLLMRTLPAGTTYFYGVAGIGGTDPSFLIAPDVGVTQNYGTAFLINATNTTDGITLQTETTERYTINNDGEHSFYNRLFLYSDGSGADNNSGVEAQAAGDIGGIQRKVSFNGQCSGGSLASPTTVANADVVYKLLGEGHDGTGYQAVAKIEYVVDGVVGTNDMPGRMDFYTTPANGGGTAVLRGSFRETGTFEVSKQAQYLLQDALATTGAVAWSLRDDPSAKINALTGNVTLTINDIALNSEGYLYVKQNAATAYTITWPATVKWAGGTAPDISTLSSEHLIALTSYDGTNLVGSFVEDFS